MEYFCDSAMFTFCVCFDFHLPEAENKCEISIKPLSFCVHSVPISAANCDQINLDVSIRVKISLCIYKNFILVCFYQNAAR